MLGNESWCLEDVFKILSYFENNSNFWKIFCFKYFHAFLCIFIHIVVHVIHFCAYLCISMHFQTCLWMCMYIWYIFVHICVLYACVYIFTHIYSWEDADLLSMKNHAAGLHSTGNWISASTLNINLSASFTGSIDIHSNAEPEWPHGTVAGSALCAYRYTYIY